MVCGERGYLVVHARSAAKRAGRRASTDEDWSIRAEENDAAPVRPGGGGAGRGAAGVRHLRLGRTR